MAEEEVTATGQGLGYEEVTEFIYGLRRNGFRITPQQYLSAHRVLIA